MSIQAHPLSTALGAEVSGVDLGQPLSEAQCQAIAGALVKHQVIFFRDQDISPHAHRELARWFGDLQTHPAYPTVDGFPEVTILEYDREKRSKIELWHTDMTFRKRPPLGTILVGRVVPQTGGDTMFASLVAAYDGLAEDVRVRIENMEAVLSFEHGFQESLAGRSRAPRSGPGRQPTGRASAGAHSPGQRAQVPVRQPPVHLAHCRPAASRERRVARIPLRTQRPCRVCLSFPLAARVDRVLGQPLHLAQAGLRLLAAAPSPRTHHHRR